MLLTLAAFVVALGLLIAVHEYGHYRVAVACGVRVQRFGIATFPVTPPEPGRASVAHRLAYWLTRPVVEWRPRRQHPGQDTVFAVGLFPVAGYVQMLGHAPDDVVPPGQEAWAFRGKRLAARFAIVAAGPVANLLLAVLLYAGANWWGIDEPRALLARPVAGSVAEQAGLRGGELVREAAFDDGSYEAVESFEEVRWMLTRAAIEGRDLRLAFARDGRAGEAVLLLSSLKGSEPDAQLFRRAGLLGPWTRPVLGDVMAGGAADRSGLRKGDLVISVAGMPVVDGQQLRELIRASLVEGRAVPVPWVVERGAGRVELNVTPAVVQDGGQVVGRIGAFVGAPPEMVTVTHGLVDGLWRGLQRTGEVSMLTLRMIGRMLVGEASVKNLSGPITIADYAGKSASMGLTQYLVFLALISVSLGVLNLLPLPVLDGGHLMYYLWEGLTGRSVSEAWMERLQRGGFAVLLAMMSIALFNDFSRLLG